MVLMPELPNALYKQLVEHSPLAMPIVFGEKRGSNIHPVLNLSKSALDAYDNQMLEQLNELAEDFRYGIISFLAWFHNKKEHIESWKSGIDAFRLMVQKGRLQSSVSDPMTDSLCAALSFFQQYLYFASPKETGLPRKWPRKSCNWYWRLVLPESVPATDKESENVSSLAYDARYTIQHIYLGSGNCWQMPRKPSYRQFPVRSRPYCFSRGSESLCLSALCCWWMSCLS